MSNKVAATWHPGTAPDSTPIDRAVDRWTHEMGLLPDEVDGTHVHAIRAALSAALTNDADPADDPIAQTVHAHRLTFDPRAPMGYHCMCGTVDESEGGHSIHVADAVRAAILGEA